MKNLFACLLFCIAGLLNTHILWASNINFLMSGIRSATRPVVFRQKEDYHIRGYDITVALTNYQGNYKVLITSWSGLPRPTPEDWPEVFAEIAWQRQFLSEARQTSSKEWDVYDDPEYGVLYRGFISPDKTVVYRTTDNHHEKDYRFSASVSYYCGAWRKLVTSYDGRPWVTTADWPELPQVLANLRLPAPGTPGTEWQIWQNQFVGHY